MTAVVNCTLDQDQEVCSSCNREVPGADLSPAHIVLTEVHRGFFHRSLQANVGVIQIRPRPLLFTASQIHHSPISPSFDAKTWATDDVAKHYT